MLKFVSPVGTSATHVMELVQSQVHLPKLVQRVTAVAKYKCAKVSLACNKRVHIAVAQARSFRTPAPLAMVKAKSKNKKHWKSKFQRASTTACADGGILGLGQGNINGQQLNTQNGYNNYASPSQGLMDYPQQGQPNQPLTPNVPPVQNNPNMGMDSSNTNMGFDNSGSDAGIGGQPVTQMQTPLQGQPPSLSQYMPQQGLQIQGNPTSMPVQRQQQR